MMPHAFAILSLFTPLDRLRLDETLPLQIGCYQPAAADKETYARLVGYFLHGGRQVRVIIDTGKGIATSKWIRLVGERRQSGRRNVISTGTPEGVGFARKPPLWMKPGDVVEVEIDGGIGVLRNPVIAES